MDSLEPQRLFDHQAKRMPTGYVDLDGLFLGALGRSKEIRAYLYCLAYYDFRCIVSHVFLASLENDAQPPGDVDYGR